jgi:hypothetical protein
MTKNNHTHLLLSTIRLIHSIIWIVMTMAVFYVFYSGISKNSTPFSWAGAALILVEGAALLIGKGECPLHLYALQLTGKDKINDTYLPQWFFFKGYKIIFTLIYLVGLLLMLFQLKP